MNNQTNNFDDVPSGESISYEHLLFYLEQGREIEFVYQEKEYFISILRKEGLCGQVKQE